VERVYEKSLFDYSDTDYTSDSDCFLYIGSATTSHVTGKIY